MTTFAFKAVDLAGVPTRGELDADDKQAVNSQLRAKGLIVLDIEEQKTTDLGDYFGRWRRVKSQELTVATRQLATMIQSGMSLLRALYVLEEQARSDKFREALTSIRMDVEAGIALSEALKRYPTIFNALYTAMVGAGEAGGILEETLERVADQLEKDDSLRRQIKAALMYPILISTFAVVVLLALVAFLVPVFEKVFKEFGGHLPAITQFTVDFSHIVTGAPYLIVGGGVGGLPQVEEVVARRPAVGPLQAEGAVEDRRSRAEGRAGALRTHLLGADRGRRSDAPGDRHHRAHVR